MADSPSSNLHDRANSVMLVLGPALVLLVAAWLSTWAGAAEFSRTIDLADTLLRSLPWVLGWLGAAAGFGWPLRRLLLPGTASPRSMQLALGLTAMMFLERLLGDLGWLQAGDSISWGILLLGLGLLLVQNRAMMSPKVRILQPVHWAFWLAIPGLAVLLAASASAPGWLWATEFGGYDALSYHLQLPKEWFNLGRIQPLDHNVYSFLPGYVEATYYHFFVLTGNDLDAAYCCQLLHGAMAVIAAALLHCFVRRIAGSVPGVVAAVLVLGTPWVIVTGSLAYNDLVPVVMLAAGLVLLSDGDVTGMRTVGALSVFAGAACAAKLSAIGFVGVPLGCLLILRLPVRRWPTACAVGILTGAVYLSPYFVSNTIATGNPVFPFASAIFGEGHWTADQVDTWREAHGPPASVAARLSEAWNQWLRFGIGANPYEAEPWKPQWSLLPWLGVIALLFAAGRRESSRWPLHLLLILAIQFLFWLTMTHIKSRFMLPSVVPLAAGVGIGAGMGIAQFRNVSWARLGTIAALVLIAGWSLQPVLIYRSEAKPGFGPAFAIGMIGKRDGSDLTEIESVTYGRSHSPAIFANYELPGQAKLLLIGEAAPFYFTRRAVTYSTVWDRGVVSQIVREHPDDPDSWIDSLSNLGYTHIYIDGAMMDRWQAAGWQDPHLSAEQWIEVLTRRGRIAVRYDEQRWLVRIDNVDVE